jgi:hypothetical protein
LKIIGIEPYSVTSDVHMLTKAGTSKNLTAANFASDNYGNELPIKNLPLKMICALTNMS